jgi:hypothetical protein
MTRRVQPAALTAAASTRQFSGWLSVSKLQLVQADGIAGVGQDHARRSRPAVCQLAVSVSTFCRWTAITWDSVCAANWVNALAFVVYGHRVCVFCAGKLTLRVHGLVKLFPARCNTHPMEWPASDTSVAAAAIQDSRATSREAFAKLAMAISMVSDVAWATLAYFFTSKHKRHKHSPFSHNELFSFTLPLACQVSLWWSCLQPFPRG